MKSSLVNRQKSLTFNNCNLKKEEQYPQYILSKKLDVTFNLMIRSMI